MKHKNIIRTLSGLSFLIFFCPFFEMCSDDNIRTIGKIRQGETPMERENRIQQGRQEYILNGYELGYYPFRSGDDFKMKDFTDIDSYAFLSFTLMILSASCIVIVVVKGRYRAAARLSFLNISLAILGMLLLISPGLLEEPSQIKFGYYLFLSIQSLLLY